MFLTYPDGKNLPGLKGRCKRLRNQSLTPTFADELQHLLESEGFGSDFTLGPLPSSELTPELGMLSGSTLDAGTTVSPQSLVLDGTMPPSTTFSGLSSPGSFESATHSADPSPYIANVSGVPGEASPDLASAALFHTDSVVPTAGALSEQPAKAESEVPAPSAQTSPASVYRPAPTNPRKRKSLSPLEGRLHSMDPEEQRRARNTQAARTSRQKKVARQKAADDRIRELEATVAHQDEELKDADAAVKTLRTYYQTLEDIVCATKRDLDKARRVVDEQAEEIAKLRHLLGDLGGPGGDNDEE
ncbi:hypothetical protein NUU61_007904 [Penicillium alfredii]|uniref:BZIP domain-containing protein n=1 Tax=Penicillium alfredii TaxID=1506179 RepID=A0A9W9JZG3_9EURO|nr:uncharacterized protein NUU61_007904 [Penicillium alfredii]KAJ5086597.1 hypothetical protein NUU61_007904 [Penicillium alfredii]